MAIQYADRIFLDFDGVIIPAKESTYNASKDTESVKPMNRTGRATGYVRGALQVELSIVVPMPKAGHEVNLDQKFLDDELFVATYLYNDGTARTFRDCIITEIDQSGAEGEGSDTTMTIMGLDMEVN